MEREDSQFQDPALKAAVKRLWGAQVAPADLQQRIVSTLAAERRTENRHRLFKLRNPLYGLAAAAVLMIAFGLTYTALFSSSERNLPAAFADALVTIHNEGPAMPEQTRVASAGNSNFRGLQSYLRRQLGHSVVAEQVNGGWQFQGASICSLGNVPASHILFTRKGETLSIFSISIGALHDNTVVEGTRFAPTVEMNHAVTGFASGNAVHCIIASADEGHPVKTGELMAMRDKLQASRPLTIPDDVGAANGK